MRPASVLVVGDGRTGRIDRHQQGTIMPEDDSPEHREVKQPTEARQGEISKGARVRKVLVISLALAVIALLIIYLAFVTAA
jgi:hypothetical protein